jgi:peptidyl-prolyl cis-trans isomerase D
VRDELVAEFRTRQAEDMFYDQANRLEELAFDAYDELASVATALGVPLETVTGYPRSGNPELFANNAPVVQAAFDEELIASGNNSRLIELADDRVMILRVTAHHPPTQLPLESVAEQIREELERAAAEELANAAATAFLGDLEESRRDAAPTEEDAAVDGDAAPLVGAASGRDLVALAEARGGTWHARRSLERTDPEVPTETLAAVFAVRAPLPEGGVRQLVPMASGDAAVFVLSAIMPGDPATVPLEARDQQQVELADDAALSEMTSYAADVRDRATIRIPDEILDPQF